MSAKPFHTISIPHKDVLEGKLGLDIFAADLWQVYNNKGPEEYKDANIFFKKTYLTEGLKNLLDIVGKRLRGEEGDPVIQLATPFGGGKTHALIALYHKAKEWKVKPVVIVGTPLSNNDTIWGIIEKQLTGKISIFSDYTAPGRDKLMELFENNQPLLILMDELLEYLIKASGRQVGNSTLAAQTLAFMQELTEAIRLLDKACLVITLPSSKLEHYDEHGEMLFMQLQHISGRVERIYTPVQDHEISMVIRQRLFSSIDESKTREIVDKFIDYANNEGILTTNMKPSEYRERFIKSYPFLPEVIDVLYHRWGSFPSFQRTRGVLRLLALVIHSLKESNISYITLANFDLNNNGIRAELIKHIGSQYNSVIAADITDSNANIKKVDSELGSSYRGLKIGSRTAITIFMYSFSGGHEKGATIDEIKIHATTLDNPASVVGDIVEQLKNKLFYIHVSADGRYFFSTEPNLTRIILTMMENIKQEEVEYEEKNLIRNNVSNKLKVFIWPNEPKDIPDTPVLKLIIMKEKDINSMIKILENKGEAPRVYKNTVIFLAPSDDRTSFENTLKKKLAYEQIRLRQEMITERQKTEIENGLKRIKDDLAYELRKLYRLVYLPVNKSELKMIDLGIPTSGENKSLDNIVDETLRREEELHEHISPLVIKEVYLKDREYIHTTSIYDTMLKTPGERRITDRKVLENCIIEGIRNGLFRLGELSKENKPIEIYDKNDVTFSENEVITTYKKISPLLRLSIDPQHGKAPLQLTIKLEIEGVQPFTIKLFNLTSNPLIYNNITSNTWTTRYTIDKVGTYDIYAEVIDSKGITLSSNHVTVTLQDEDKDKGNTLTSIKLTFDIARGKVSDIMRIISYLQSKFSSIRIELSAKEGHITTEEYNIGIKEALRQLGISYIDEIEEKEKEKENA
ncbi:MAG: DUF499 domain-containing protein [Candidatus Nitrosocaldaceae archaeon]